MKNRSPGVENARKILKKEVRQRASIGAGRLKKTQLLDGGRKFSVEFIRIIALALFAMDYSLKTAKNSNSFS